MSTAKIPGNCARLCRITDNVRKDYGSEGAIDEALRRIRETYIGIDNHWGPESGVRFHVALTVETPESTK